MISTRVAASLFFLTFCLEVQGCHHASDPYLSEVIIQPNAAGRGEEAFSPNPAIVSIGGRVVWFNSDAVTHSVAGNAKEGPCAFDSKEIAPGATFTQRFAEAAECTYFCRLHGQAMRGRLQVGIPQARP
jgi:plastocyanin